MEEKIQLVSQKIKRGLSVQEYSTIYPTGSCPDKFYGTSKVHKLPENVGQLPIRPIVSNIGNCHLPTGKIFSKTFVPFESVSIHCQEH